MADHVLHELRDALMSLLDPPLGREPLAPLVRPVGVRAIAVGAMLTSATDASKGAGEQLGGRRVGGDASRGASGRQRRRPSPESARSTIDLDQIVTEFTPAVYRLARSVVRDPGLADDVAQETFIKVWKHLDEYRGEGSMRGWVLRIAHNTAVSTLRRVKDTATDPERLPHAHEPISTNRVVEGRLAHSALQDELDRLDELSREIVVLREVEGLSYDEIAETLDVPVPTVKTRLLRARRRLSVALEGWRP